MCVPNFFQSHVIFTSQKESNQTLKFEVGITRSLVLLQPYGSISNS